MSQLRRWLLGGPVALWIAACAESIAPTPGPSPPVRLAFTIQPGSATAGVAMDPVVAVAIQDAAGDLVPSAPSMNGRARRDNETPAQSVLDAPESRHRAVAQLHRATAPPKEQP